MYCRRIGYSSYLEFFILAFGRFSEFARWVSYWYFKLLIKILNLNNYRCDHLNWIKTLQGIALGIQSFGGELPFFFLSGN